MKKYFVVVIILISGLMVAFYFNQKNNLTYSYVESENIISELVTDGASIVYTGDMSDNIKEKFKDIYDTYRISLYYSNMNLKEINDLLSSYNLTSDSDNVFIICMNGVPVDIVSVDDDNAITEKLEKYLYNKIPANETYYKVLSTADEYIKKVNSKKYTIAVFGMDDCTYCDLYLPVVNNIAKNYSLDIYYFNKSIYDEDEYEKIMDLDFTIPAKCTTTGYETSLSKSFPKPMTIITKSGEFVDCIRGYVTEDDVLTLLKEYGIVEE